MLGAAIRAILGTAGSSGGALTQVFATFDPTTNPDTDITLSNGDLTITGISGASAAISDISLTSGKHYFEVTIDSATNLIYNGIGLVTAAWHTAQGGISVLADNTGVGEEGYAYQANGLYRYPNDQVSPYHGNAANGDVFMVAVDMDIGAMWVGRNGVWNEGDPAAGTGAFASWDTELAGKTLFPGAGANTGSIATANFGATAFAHTVPAGFREGIYTE